MLIICCTSSELEICESTAAEARVHKHVLGLGLGFNLKTYTLNPCVGLKGLSGLRAYMGFWGLGLTWLRI